MDDRLLDAAVAVLDEHGFAGLTLERVAERAGRSRVTLWRQGVTQDALLDGLLARLTREAAPTGFGWLSTPCATSRTGSCTC
jgi:AcrR family transcriptional regulator